MAKPPANQTNNHQRLTKRIERFYDKPPGGRTMWVVVIGVALSPLGVLGAIYEFALIVLGILCVGLTAILWVTGTVWEFAVIKEREGWKGLISVILTARFSYRKQHWDVLRRPVCLSAGALLFIVYLLIPLSIYAVTHS